MAPRVLGVLGFGLLVVGLLACTPVPPSAPTPPAAAPGQPEPTTGPPPLEAHGMTGVRPPLTPRWVYEPWVWEDEKHTAEAVLELVDGYQRADIPVGAVIIDSPWQTNYNTFQFGPNYPDPVGLIQELHRRKVRVVLWATGLVNVKSEDSPEQGKAANYDEAAAAGHFVDDGKTYEWEKGEGSPIDFFDPAATRWWYGQLDKAFALGIDGWKVDSPEGNLPDGLRTADGLKTNRQYGEATYRAFYRYVAERGREAIITARPYDGGTVYAPVDANPAGWVGDQQPTWEGLEEALENILASAERGYAVLGSDIGGYNEGVREEDLFIRWTQLGALSPLMENGGQGEHRPWKLGPEVLRSYRYYAKLHHQLVPYLYSAGVEAHRTGQPIIRDIDRRRRQYSLGPDLLVAPITSEKNEREVRLPAGSRWYAYWDDDRVLSGGKEVEHKGPTDRMPLFIRAGAIIPLQVDDDETGHGGAGSRDRLTLLVYPAGESVRTYYPDAERAITLRSRREPGGVSVEIGQQTERYVLRIKEQARPLGIQLERGGVSVGLPAAPSWKAFDQGGEAWYYDEDRNYLWVRFSTEQAAARLSYRTR